MKRLLYILLLLPLFVQGQALKSGNDLLSTHNFKGSYCFRGFYPDIHYDGNWINCGFKITGRTPMTFAAYVYNTDFTSFVNDVFLCGGHDYAGNGISISLRYGKVFITINDGVSKLYLYSPVLNYGLNLIQLSWSGLANDSIYLYVNGSLFSTFFTDKDWIGDSHFNLQINSYYNGHTTSHNNIFGIKYWKSVESDYDAPNPYIYYPLDECDWDFSTVYDASGNGHNGVAYGTHYRIVCSENTYNLQNGCTKVTYGDKTVFVPYLMNGTSQYSAVSPVINAAESHRDYDYQTRYIIRK